MAKQYDYIITGAGCAGLSLLMRMMREPFFSQKQILVIDRLPKTENDRTWCFWEKEPGLFEPIVYHQWEKVHFYADSYSATMDITPYTYKMIRGIDFYAHVKQEAARHPNIVWRYEQVKAIDDTGIQASVVLNNETVTADFIFNSILFREPPIAPATAAGYYLLQHFTGWLIEAEAESFDPSVATYMDFRISQEQGTSFMYVLPVSKTTALVEYTLFTEKLLQPAEYATALKAYIASYLNITRYSILHEEFGVIPMTNRRFPLQKGNIVYMGIAGGQAKGSSGYAFQFIQKRTRQIVDSLIKNGHPFIRHSLADKKFQLYDSVLLHVLHHHKMAGDRIFANIFQKNPAGRVLRFLDNETSIGEDLQIMRSVPSRIFLPAAIQEIFRS